MLIKHVRKQICSPFADGADVIRVWMQVHDGYE